MSTDARQLSRLVAAPETTSFVGPEAPSLAGAMADNRGKKLDEIFKEFDSKFNSWRRQLYQAVSQALAKRSSASSKDPRVRWQKWILYQNTSTGSAVSELTASDGGSGLTVQLSASSDELASGKLHTYALVSIQNVLGRVFPRVTLTPKLTAATVDYRVAARRINPTPVGGTTIVFLFWLETIEVDAADSQRMELEAAYIDLI